MPNRRFGLLMHDYSTSSPREALAEEGGPEIDSGWHRGIDVTVTTTPAVSEFAPSLLLVAW